MKKPMSYLYRSCKNKVVYKNQEWAQEEADRLMADPEVRSIRPAEPIVPYKCAFCGWWHVGRQAPHHRQERGPSEEDLHSRFYLG